MIRHPKDYWEQLQRVIDMALSIQASPIPVDEMVQQINLMRLGYAEYELNAMLKVLPRIQESPSENEAPAPVKG
jgi:hypothetical protein